MGRTEHMANPKVNPRKMRRRVHLRLDGAPNELGLCVHKDEEVARIMEGIAIGWKPLGGNPIRLQVLQREILNDAVLNMNLSPKARTQKEMDPNPAGLELIEEPDVPVDRLVDRTRFIETDQCGDKGRLHLQYSVSAPVSIYRGPRGMT